MRRPAGETRFAVGRDPQELDLARNGVAVIVVSSDLEEVLGVSGRIMVMAQGKQTGILDRKDANDVSVMELATI